MVEESTAMTDTPSDSTSHILRFSTDNVPEKDRLPYFREFFGRRFLRTEIEPLTEYAPHTSVMLASLADVLLMHGNTTGISLGRTRQLITDGNDGLTLALPQFGTTLHVRQCEREAATAQGEATLLLSNEEGSSILPRGGQLLSLGLLLRRLKAMAPNIEDCIALRIPRETPALRLLTGYLDIWRHGELATTPEMRRTFSDHIYDLVALLFGAKGEAAEQAAQGGLRAARLAEARREIARSARDPDFSLPALAGRIGTSPSYVQKLLSEANTSFTTEIAERRLGRARRLLQSPRHRHLSIAEIAYQCGFPAVKYFHRAFRARYDATPGDVRAGVAASGSQ
jgi:AraC-like DNA-binding protein